MDTIDSSVKSAAAGLQTVRGESLVLAGTAAVNLCFDQVVEGSVSIRRSYRPSAEADATYREGEDYIVDYARGTVARTRGSAIPDYAAHVFFGRKDFDHGTCPEYSNHPFFVWADYTSRNGRAWAQPNDQRRFLAQTRAKLEAGGPFRLVGYGDSITSGCEASAPELRFVNRFGDYLQRRFPRAQVTVEDASIPGYTSAHGIAWWDQYLGKTSPDLVLLGWGMNDHNNVDGIEPGQFKDNLATLVAMVRERKGAETVLFSAFPPHEDWRYGTHRMEIYAALTRRAAAETASAYADVWSVWQQALQRKDQSSLLANNINHPNDFGHWLYLQALEAMNV